MGISKEFAHELSVALHAQNHLIQRLTSGLDEVEEQLAEVDDQAAEIRKLEEMMATLEANVHLLDGEDLEDFQPSQIEAIYERHKKKIASELPVLPERNWKEFVNSCLAYESKHGLDPFLPYDAFLTKDDLKKLRAESYDAQFRWDRWDYIFVGASGALAALTDYMLVGIPKTMKSVLGANLYEGQEGSPLTGWIKSKVDSTNGGWFGDWASWLEENCKVPYDTMSVHSNGASVRISGITPKTHRLQSLGHDPVLGFVFGVMDIMKGTFSGFSYDKLTRVHELITAPVKASYNPVGLIEAFLIHFGHLVSDVGTKQGLPPPFFTAFKDMNVGSFGAKGTPIGGIARSMYHNGYDLRHFFAAGITPAIVEMVLRAYLMIRHYCEHGETKFLLGSNPKYRSMFLAAHGIAAAGNVGKVALWQGNPLAINYAEWMALVRYFVPHMKYWLFDKARLQIEHMEAINEQGWNELEAQNGKIMELIASASFPLIELGK